MKLKYRRFFSISRYMDSLEYMHVVNNVLFCDSVLLNAVPKIADIVGASKL